MILINQSRLIELEAARIAREMSPIECSVYILFAKDGDGPMYVKVGISKTPGARIRSVQTGCPIRILRAIAFTCSSARTARAAEIAFHSALEPYKASGEWFRLEWSDEVKASLHETVEKVMDTIRGKDLREVSHADGRTEIAQRNSRVMKAERQAREAAYNKHRLNVELRAPLNRG